MYIKSLFSILFLFIVLIVCGACQKSIPEIIISEQENQLTANSRVADLIRRTVLNDGSGDNIIDNANCITVKLPVTIIVNGQTLNINTIGDFQLIENIFEEFSNDDDTLEILFPIIIILEDYSEIGITSQSELLSFSEQCLGENVEDEDIECVDFIYPLVLDVLKVGESVPTTTSFFDDKAVYQFIDGLDDEDIAGFNFPINLLSFDGSEISITSVEVLEATLEYAINICDEDDDFDYNDDDDIILLNFLINGNWIIDEYSFNDDDFTKDYNGYVFNFKENSEVSASNGIQSINGNWSVDNTDINNLLVILNFGNIPPFDVLNENWKITESEVDRLALEIGSEAGMDLKILVFEKL